MNKEQEIKLPPIGRATQVLRGEALRKFKENMEAVDRGENRCTPADKARIEKTVNDVLKNSKR